jgi:hypothetical protein
MEFPPRAIADSDRSVSPLRFETKDKEREKEEKEKKANRKDEKRDFVEKAESPNVEKNAPRKQLLSDLQGLLANCLLATVADLSQPSAMQRASSSSLCTKRNFPIMIVTNSINSAECWTSSKMPLCNLEKRKCNLALFLCHYCKLGNFPYVSVELLQRWIGISLQQCPNVNRK